MKEKQTHVRIANVIISFFVVAGMFILYRIITDFAFLTNDDMYLQAIVSGELSGAPDAHMIHSNMILGIVLKFLYQCSTQIPWYGIYMVGVYFLCAWLILYRCLSKSNTVIAKIATTVFYLIICFCVLFRHVAMVQYTVLAAFSGGTAIFYALTMDMQMEKKKIVREFIIVLFLASVSLIIREEVFFMLVPFAAFGWLGKWIAEKNRLNHINRRYIIFLLCVISVMICVCATDRIAYKLGEDAGKWQAFLKYNKAREQVYDYYLYPDYDSNEELYDEIGISREAYEGASKHYLLLPQEKINSETIQIIADKSKEIAKDKINFKEKMIEVNHNFIQCNLNYTDRPMNIVVYSVWLCMVILAILSKRRNMCTQLALLFLVRMGMWLYILWQGRYPDRITQSLYFVELIMLVAIFIINKNVIDDKTVLKYLFLCGAVFVICVPSLYVGINKAIDIKSNNARNLSLGIAYQQLKDYCSQHDDNLYLADMNSVTHFKSSVLKSSEGEFGVCDNLLPLGSWPNKSPLVAKTLSKYDIDDVVADLVDNASVYFVFKDEETITPQYLEDFFNSEMSPIETKLKKEEIYKTDVGINFIFYKLESTQQ